MNIIQIETTTKHVDETEKQFNTFFLKYLRAMEDHNPRAMEDLSGGYLQSITSIAAKAKAEERDRILDIIRTEIDSIPNRMVNYQAMQMLLEGLNAKLHYEK